MFNFGIKQVYEQRWEAGWMQIEYLDGNHGWIWRNLNAFIPETATWVVLRPLGESK
jgi:hypothetical protein